MKINLINTTKDFLSFWNDSKDLPIEKQKELWKDQYYKNNKEIFDVYFSNWGNMKSLDSSLERYQDITPNIESNLVNIQERIEDIAKKEEKIFNLNDKKNIEVNVVLMVGFFTSNGWATKFNGKSTIFLALEFFQKPEYVDVLIAHELAHGIYNNIKIIDQESSSIGLALFNEGLATMTTEIMYPEVKEVDHLWFGTDIINLTEWIRSIETNIESIKSMVIKDISNIDKDTNDKYFTMKSYKGEFTLPVRVGYYIGVRALKVLYKEYDVTEMVGWNEKEILDKMKEAIQKI